LFIGLNSKQYAAVRELQLASDEPSTTAAATKEPAADEASSFLFYERASFTHPGNAEEKAKFQELATRVIPKLVTVVGVSLLATGLSNEGIWAIWDMHDVQGLWAAMTLTGKDAEYAAMQDLIVGESQNFCHVTKVHTAPLQTADFYYYDILTQETGAVGLQEALLKAHTAPHEPNWTWSVTISSITGRLYEVTRIWRCDAAQEAPVRPGMVRWQPAQYEPRA
jgi:hypothetical protein